MGKLQTYETPQTRANRSALSQQVTTRRDKQTHTKAYQIQERKKIHKRSTALERSVNLFTGGLKTSFTAPTSPLIQMWTNLSHLYPTKFWSILLLQTWLNTSLSWTYFTKCIMDSKLIMLIDELTKVCRWANSLIV